MSEHLDLQQSAESGFDYNDNLIEEALRKAKNEYFEHYEKNP